MLSNGIYEQIVNSKIGNELKKLDPEKYDVNLESLDADDARKILTIYISFVIQQGLRYVRDCNSNSDDVEALVAQIKLCNDIIQEVADHTKEPDFQDSKILEKGEVLTSLYEKINSVRSIKKVDEFRPKTSILENSLFTGASNEPAMMSELRKEIMTSDRVDILVSFIKQSGLNPLFSALKEFTNQPGSKLRVITTVYTGATDYKAILQLASLPNTEIKINYETKSTRMHAKSYFFHRDTGFSTAYIGSSNISNAALTDGLEWNVKVTEKESFDIVKKFEVSFDSYWNNDTFETFNPNNEEHRNKLQTALKQSKYGKKGALHLQLVFSPYWYQQKILDTLEAEREIHHRYKNLIVAATGVGKTVIAAFDYKNFRKKHTHARLLFVAHREEILKQSLETFREILNDFNFGDLYVGGNKPDSIDYLFVSIQSLNSSKMTEWTTSDYYDFIIVDEFHHAAADSYQKLLEHYTPKILLGLTATPERMDGKDILKYFDGRIASSMLLGEAIDENLLSTFQYYGIADDIDYRKTHWINGKYDIHELESIYTADDKRCSLILNSMDRYIADLDDVKGLGFCVSIKHANYMADYFNKHGVPAVSLSARSIENDRAEARGKLVKGEIKFIFVVDLYNEGVDIPQINTILFLRPTESATVFMQQLGRGLRLAEGKDCLTVLDFVGQANRKYRYGAKYKALTGNNEKSVRKQFEEGFSNIPRGCYIEFEDKAKEAVLENLKQTDSTKIVLTERIRTFEEDTGKKLSLSNFLDEYNLTLYSFYQNSGARSLYRLMKWAGILENANELDDEEYTKIYSSFTGLFHINSIHLLDYWIRYIKGDYSPRSEEERIMRNMLYYTFYKKCPEKEGVNNIEDGIRRVIEKKYIREELIQILEYNKEHVEFISSKNEYDYICPLDIHASYNIKQILAAYGYYDEYNSPEFREGVKYFADKKTDIFLINLNKSDKDFSPSTMYDDYAINTELFHWQSQSQDHENSPKIQRYIHHRKQGTVVSLFVREFKRDGSYTCPYIFLGNVDYIKHEGECPVSFVWHLHNEIPADLIKKANKTSVV